MVSFIIEKAVAVRGKPRKCRVFWSDGLYPARVVETLRSAVKESSEVEGSTDKWVVWHSEEFDRDELKAANPALVLKIASCRRKKVVEFDHRKKIKATKSRRKASFSQGQEDDSKEEDALMLQIIREALTEATAEEAAEASSVVAASEASLVSPSIVQAASPSIEVPIASSLAELPRSAPPQPEETTSSRHGTSLESVASSGPLPDCVASSGPLPDSSSNRQSVEEPPRRGEKRRATSQVVEEEDNGTHSPFAPSSTPTVTTGEDDERWMTPKRPRREERVPDAPRRTRGGPHWQRTGTTPPWRQLDISSPFTSSLDSPDDRETKDVDSIASSPSPSASSVEGEMAPQEAEEMSGEAEEMSRDFEQIRDSARLLMDLRRQTLDLMKQHAAQTSKQVRRVSKQVKNVSKQVKEVSIEMKHVIEQSKLTERSLEGFAKSLESYQNDRNKRVVRFES